MAKPVVFVIGASGNVGAATVTALSAKYADKVEIRAGVRNPEAADKLKGLNGVTLVAAEMGGDRDKLVTTLRGVDALFIVTPGTKDRAELAISTAEAAKDAGVKFLLVVSVLTADLTNTVFGAQFTKLERAVAQLGVTHSFLRLPLFVENYWGFKDTIKGHSAFYSPVDPDKPFTPVVCRMRAMRLPPYCLIRSPTPTKRITLSATDTLSKTSLRHLVKHSAGK